MLPPPNRLIITFCRCAKDSSETLNEHFAMGRSPFGLSAHKVCRAFRCSPATRSLNRRGARKELQAQRLPNPVPTQRLTHSPTEQVQPRHKPRQSFPRSRTTNHQPRRSPTTSERLLRSHWIPPGKRSLLLHPKRGKRIVPTQPTRRRVSLCCRYAGALSSGPCAFETTAGSLTSNV